MPAFSTSFSPPSAPGGFTIEADIPSSAVRLTWDPSGIAQVDFGGFRVYRSLDGGLTYELLAVLALVDDVAYNDYAAPLNTLLAYRLTQSDLDLESDPVEGTVSLDSSRWWVVVPEDLDLTFSIPKLRSATLTSPKVQDVYSPIGRAGKLVVGDVVQAEDGQIAFLAMPDNLGMVSLMKAIQSRMEGGIILKATDGSVWLVQYGSMTRSFTAVGLQEITIPFTGVG